MRNLRFPTRDHLHSQAFLLQRAQPALSGLMDGSLSTLAPIFAVVLATHHPLTAFYTPPKTVWTPRVLKDGSDSVGVLGALNRVYLNIGLFSEEWLRHFNPVVGGKPITPIQIAVAERNSAYWRATEAATPDTAEFFLEAAKPDHLSVCSLGTQAEDIPG